MTNPDIKNQVAKGIQDMFFSRGASVDKNVYDQLLLDLTRLEAATEARVVGEIREKIEANKACEFKSDGTVHDCVSGCSGAVENCVKCHRDVCSNKNCPLGKGVDNGIIKNLIIKQILALLPLQEEKNPQVSQSN